jgi:hypothetical protein
MLLIARGEMNQVQCRVDVLRCQSVGGLTPARAF